MKRPELATRAARFEECRARAQESFGSREQGAGESELEAAEACILAPLSSDGAITEGLRELAAASLLASAESQE